MPFQSGPLAPGGRRARLLLLIDEEAHPAAADAVLPGRGFNVDDAGAEEAEALLGCEPIDVAILDLSLSPFGPDGLEVLRSIRALQVGLPVVIFSANIRPEVEEECRRLGVSAVLTKPQSLSVLAHAVALCLRDR